MHLWVRAAASPSIGLGHLLRQVALVEEAVTMNLSATIVVDDTAFARSSLRRFAALNFGLRPANGPWSREVGPGDIVMFDGYQFDGTDHAVARRTGALVAAMDDRGSGTVDVDVLCDHNPTPVSYDLAPGVILLHGPQYALVRSEFLGGRRPSSGRAHHLLVAFGGSDAAGLLPDALVALRERRRFPEVTLLLGPASPVMDGPLPPGVAAVVAPTRVANVHGSADAAVITLGTTLWELLARGMPTAAISLNPLHQRITDAVAQSGAVIDAGSAKGWLDRLPVTLDRLTDPRSRGLLADHARGLVDGQGARRLLLALIERVRSQS